MLIDTTLREGAQAYGVYFSVQDRKRIAAGLFELGVEELEIGWAGMDGLPEFLDWARPAAGATVLSLWSRCRADDVAYVASHGAERINIGVPASEAHREQRLGLSRTALCVRLEQVVNQALSSGIRFVSVGLEDVSRADPGFSLELGRRAIACGAQRIRLSDSVGILDPHGIDALVRRFRSELPGTLGVHCHNDFGLATANTLAALTAGADYADVALLGLGERAGIARLEEVAAWLAFRKDDHYRTQGLTSLCHSVATAACVPLPRNAPVVGTDAFATEAGLHVHAQLKDHRLFEPFPPETVGNARRLGLGAKSGRAAVNALLDAPTQTDHLARRVAEAKSLSTSRGRPLTSAERSALARSIH